MNQVERLISQLCAEGVPFFDMEEVCTRISSGGTPDRSRVDFFTGEIPWLRTQEVDFKEVFDTEIKITEAALKASSAQWVPANTVTIAMYGATAGKSALLRIPVTTNQACCNLEVNLNVALPEYVFHWLKENYLYIKSLGQGTQFNLNARQIRQLRIPTPPLEIQHEIVRILDKFTDLEAELEIELDARKTQFEYYRELLLSEAHLSQYGSSLTTLGQVGKFIRGKGIQKVDLHEEGLPAIHYGQIHAYYGTSTCETKSFVSQDVWNKSSRAKRGDLIIATTSESVEDVCKATAWLGDSEVAVSADAMIYSHDFDPLFATYFFQSHHFGVHKPRVSTGTKVKRISSSKMSEIQISVPSRDVQTKIGEALFRLELLATSPNEGLPAEIAARRKQYEYYRGKLLNFSELAVT